ncbi:hypothetical protein [Capnocytophaga canis]|uniref:hypothetical protein n=1 Tax=Capnocytophaga canis TaxID=1848903 RepID=UPI001BB33709|nr:hypothetical protein [Capnocytophaga canis]
MIERDYLKKQIDLFFQELVAVLTKKTVKETRFKEISNLSEKYTQHGIDFFITSSFEEITASYGKDIETLDIIIELLFQMKDESIEIVDKLEKIINYTNQNSLNYSFRRNEILTQILVIKT